MPGMPGMPMPSSVGSQAAPESSSGHTIFVAPQRQQLIGVQSVPAALRSLVKEIRTVGKVAYDETKLTHIHTKVTGYIEQVFVDYVGKIVNIGDPLFTIYSPDLVSTQEEYLLALRSRNTSTSYAHGQSSWPTCIHNTEICIRPSHLVTITRRLSTP